MYNCLINLIQIPIEGEPHQSSPLLTLGWEKKSVIAYSNQP